MDFVVTLTNAFSITDMDRVKMFVIIRKADIFALAKI